MCDKNDISRHKMSELTDVQMEILNYLDENIDEIGYVKSKNIANNLDKLSIRKVGANMKRVSERSENFDIEIWSDSGAMTWKIKRIN